MKIRVTMPRKPLVVLSGRAGGVYRNSRTTSTLLMSLQPVLPAPAQLLGCFKSRLWALPWVWMLRHLPSALQRGFLAAAMGRVRWAGFLLHTLWWIRCLGLSEMSCFPKHLVTPADWQEGCIYAHRYLVFNIEPRYIKVGGVSFSFKDRALL